MLYLKCVKHPSFFILSVLLLAVPFKASSEDVWTLEKTVKRAVEVSPVVNAANAEIAAKQGSLSQAGAWPNPSIEVGGSQKLGIEDGRGGQDLTEFSVSQPIPLGRLSRQKRQAEAELKVSGNNRFYQQLLQENASSVYFHKLQLSEAKLGLAKEQLKFAQYYHGSEGEKDPLVRYLTPLEKKRIHIIEATASQALKTAEGEYQEALSNFKAFLGLPRDVPIKTEQIGIIDSAETLETMTERLEATNPQIAAAKAEKEAANAAISLARGSRFEDPEIKFFRERDTLDNRRQNFNGAMVNVTVPLWDFKNGDVSKAQAEAKKADYELEALTRDLRSKLSESYLHLRHLNERAKHNSTSILVPAKEMFDLTKKSFGAGEVNVLSLVDARDTYFNSRTSYMELVYESLVEMANLRLIAGISLMDEVEVMPDKIEVISKKNKGAK